MNIRSHHRSRRKLTKILIKLLLRDRLRRRKLYKAFILRLNLRSGRLLWNNIRYCPRSRRKLLKQRT
jgi:hypothetical protein